MASRCVLFLEDDSDLRTALKTLVEDQLGYKVICAESLHDMIANSADVLDCQIAFLDIDLGKHQPNGVDAFNWLRQNGFTGHISFLTAHGKSHPLVIQARGAHTDVLAKPVVPAILLGMIERCNRATGG